MTHTLRDHYEAAVRRVRAVDGVTYIEGMNTNAEEEWLRVTGAADQQASFVYNSPNHAFGYAWNDLDHLYEIEEVLEQDEDGRYYPTGEFVPSTRRTELHIGVLGDASVARLAYDAFTAEGFNVSWSGDEDDFLTISL